jgi:hypothetical protein
VPVVLLTFTPKCVLCLAAYLAAGTALRFGAPEICGATPGSAGLWLAWLPAPGLAIGAAAFFACHRRDRRRPVTASTAC